MGRSAVKQVREVLKGLLSGPGIPANVALWVFDSEVKKLRDFSSDVSDLEAGIDEIGAVIGRADKTKLYEAIGLVLFELSGHKANGAKRLILVTAGRDDGSSITEQVVLNEANEQNIAIDAIAFGNVSDAGSNLLARLAKDTNGKYLMSAANAPQFAHELQKLLDLKPSHVIEVLFQYPTALQSHKVNSAQLEFVPNGKPILLPIRNDLTPPQEGPLGGGLPYQPAIGKENVNRLIILWISIGLTGFSAAYIMSRIQSKRRAKSAKKDDLQHGHETDSKEP